MKFKKTLLAFCLIMCIFFCVSSVAAGDVNDTIVGSDDNQIELSQDLINDMKEEDNLKRNEVDEILTANPKTFSSLNTTINGNDDGDVYLDSNYTFELGSDADFKDGVTISRAVTIHGNGYTIDGDNAARIFTVTNDNVVFKNIIFINGKTPDMGDGGAIKGECIAVNCTFDHNLASYYGGAMSGGSAVNCIFNHNTASKSGLYTSGGAMSGGSAVNCTFNYNSASYGGAMSGGSAVNCTFTNNHASDYGGAIRYGSAVNCTFDHNSASYYGGAMRDASAVNCTFNSNSAYLGGAMGDGSAINCIFTNNTASNYGGAMCGDGYIATQCQFINNTAKNGGATYQITANNSTFTKNTATENGGAVYNGVASNSTFTQNYANKDGGAVYDSLIVNCLFEYNSAENGGAISRGRATNCTFNNNNATNYGGAAYNAKISTNSKFNNNVALNGTETDSVTWFDPLNTKSFFDLNELINNNTQTDIYLNNNYLFDLNKDADFKDGVTISRAVTIHGNGYTIDGDNVARIFTVTNDNVVFKNIIFINGKTPDMGDGGAIKGECIAVNCTFDHNLASSSGGAMSGGSAVNCIFNHNTASKSGLYTYGGAMSGGSAVNCTFNYNSASYGGAMSGGSAVNCTFTNNHASDYGGAIRYGSAVNCTFNSNSASIGGAMRDASAVNCTYNSNSAYLGGAMGDGSAINCIFTNNTASNYGGAMCGDGYIATQCQFINNTAKNGGATYQITANNSTFTKNTATENGGAMYEGAANNCVFKDNKAGIRGDDTYNTTLPKPIFSVSNFTSTYNSGDKLLFNLTTASGLPINNANITIRVYKNNALVGTYYALSGEGWVVELDVGSYIAVCSVENQAYEVEPANATLTITQDSSKVTSSAVTTAYNGGKYLVVTLKDSKNRPISNVKVSINLNGLKTLTTDNNGQVKLTTNALVPKTYTAVISFDGNANYFKSSTSVKVTVKKATPKLTAKKKTFKKSVKTKKYTITLKTNTNKAMKKVKVTLKIKGKTYKATTNAKGKAVFKIKKLTKKGTYKATVTYKGNKCYNKVTKKVKITVK